MRPQILEVGGCSSYAHPSRGFGGKSRAASLVWEALGNVANYVEPFAGSAAVLLARPHAPRCETINDRDGMVANFWRAVKAAPDEVAHHADWPVNEADLHARHRWLIGQRESLTERLVADPEWFDARVAGWWVWGLSAWIGDGWCPPANPSRKLPSFGNNGRGVHASRVIGWRDLAARLATVDVACGEWDRVTSPTVVLRAAGIAGVYLDPPYAEGAQQYAAGGTGTGLSAAVRAWCEEHGSNPRVRIVLSGYEGEHDALQRRGWRIVEWSATGAGYVAAGGERANQRRERLWLSPHCEGARQLSLLGGAS